MNELISVIIPLYNKEKWIKKTLESVINQSFKNIEILIIDDGSTDDSLKKVKEIHDNRITIFTKKNGGVSSARNLGISKARSKFVAFLDGDDIWDNKHLEILINGFNLNSNALLVCSNYKEISSYKQIKYNSIELPLDIKYTKLNSYIEDLAKSNFSITSSSVLIKLNYILENNLTFDTELTIGEDINFWLKLNQYGSFIKSDFISMYYLRNDQLSIMNNNKLSVNFIPNYFKNINIDNFTPTYKNYLKVFIKNEFIKKAFQNRGKKFNQKEILKNSENGTIYLNIIDLVKYLVIRFLPNFLFKVLKKLKKG